MQSSATTTKPKRAVVAIITSLSPLPFSYQARCVRAVLHQSRQQGLLAMRPPITALPITTVILSHDPAADAARSAATTS